MQTLETLSELARAARNLIRIGVIIDVDSTGAAETADRSYF